jgi:hypothetical protein
MCIELCNNSPVGFNKITNSSFNRFSQTMGYIHSHRSDIDSKKAAKYKITNFLATNLNTCPRMITKMALSSLNKIMQYK